VLGPLIEGIAEVLGPILEDIFGAFSDMFDWISDSVLTWANDVADWFINVALMGFVGALAGFFIWFINGIGTLLGITDLAGIIATSISNFVGSITSFLLGIVFIFTYGIGIFSFAIGIITTYGPLLVYYGFWILALTTLFTIATMDDKKIMDLFSFYARILERLLEIFYWVANMIIQFIGGIIP